MLVSRNSRLGFCVLKLDSFKARVLFRFCLVTQRFLSLPNLSRKIEGPLLAGHKLINNNFFKDNSFQQNLVLDILNKLSCQSYTHEKGNILGKNPLLILLFAYYSFKIKIAPFLKS